jgi:hypothetical protein
LLNERGKRSSTAPPWPSPVEKPGISALDLKIPVLVVICATALREHLLTLRRTEAAKLNGDGRSVD